MARVRYCRHMIRVYLGHGASGTAASMAPWVDGLRDRGIEAHALELPKRKAEDAVAAYEAQVPDEPGAVIGGHSFGGQGRLAGRRRRARRRAPSSARTRTPASSACPIRSTARAAPRPPTRGSRTGPRSTSRRCCCPGPPTRSPGSTSSRRRCRGCADGRLVTYPKLGHGLLPVRDDVLDRVAAFLAGLDGGSAPHLSVSRTPAALPLGGVRRLRAPCIGAQDARRSRRGSGRPRGAWPATAGSRGRRARSRPATSRCGARR